MNGPIPREESDFHARVDAILEAIQAAVDALDADDGVDSEINGGVLTLEFADGGKVIVNRQTPLREIWVAAKSGGFHFRFDGATWRDTRGGEALGALLARVVSAQRGHVTPITI